VAKSTYKPELIDPIISKIVECGNIERGIEESTIKRRTFYAWLKKYPEIGQRVAEAKEEFRRTCPQELKIIAKKTVADYLLNGNVIQWESTINTEIIIQDPTGKVLEIQHHNTRKSHTERRPPPQWVIERVLGSKVDVLEAIELLLQEGVATQDQAQIVAEGIAAIESKLKSLSGNRSLPEGEVVVLEGTSRT
jgi:hypothetical protein